jgi:hypothetical protein
MEIFEVIPGLMIGTKRALLELGWSSGDAIELIRRQRGVSSDGFRALSNERFVTWLPAEDLPKEDPETTSISTATQDAALRTPNRMSYAAAGGPNQVVSASASPSWVPSPTQATYPSGRINTAVGAVTAPSAGSSHVPEYLASMS